MATIGVACVAPSPYLFVSCCWCPIFFPPEDLVRWFGRASRWSDTATLCHDACLLDQLWNSHEIANHREDLTMKSWHSPAKIWSFDEIYLATPWEESIINQHKSGEYQQKYGYGMIRPWCLLTRFTSPPASIGQNRLEWQHTAQWFISHMSSCIWPKFRTIRTQPAHGLAIVWIIQYVKVFRMVVD